MVSVVENNGYDRITITNQFYYTPLRYFINTKEVSIKKLKVVCTMYILRRFEVSKKHIMGASKLFEANDENKRTS